MTLQQIYKRLELFPEYLEYKLDNIHQWPILKLNTFKSTGMFFISDLPLYTFDQWLCHRGDSELSEPICEYYKLPIPEQNVERGKFITNNKNEVIWQVDPNGSWLMASHHYSK